MATKKVLLALQVAMTAEKSARVRWGRTRVGSALCHDVIHWHSSGTKLCAKLFRG
jgi:hypothetical protein